MTALLLELQQLSESIESTRRDLLAAKTKMAETLSATLRAFTTLAEERNHGTRTRRITELTLQIAQSMNLPQPEADQIKRSAMLHHLGRHGFADHLLNGPQEGWRQEDIMLWRSYPVRSEELIKAFPALRAEAAIIRSHCERFDGLGFPDRLSGDAIPLGSRILAFVIAFDSALGSASINDRDALLRAAQEIWPQSGRRLCPTVMEAFLKLFHIPKSHLVAHDASSSSCSAPASRSSIKKRLDLRVGMTLDRDVLSPSGSLLLPAGQTIEPAILALLTRFEERNNVKLSFSVLHDPRWD